MKPVIVKIMSVFILCVCQVKAEDVIEKVNAETTFPENVVIQYHDENINLMQTGSTMRKKFFLKIYAMAHYIEQKAAMSFNGDGIYQTILEQTGAKQISMVFLRSLTSEQIQESLLTGLESNSNKEDFAGMLPQIEVFMRAIDADVNENDEFTLHWLADGTVISFFQGNQISSVKNTNFARTLWSIWFGDNSVVDRKMLVKELLTSS